MPVDLVLYWDWERDTPWTANEAPFGSPNSFVGTLALPVLKPILDSRSIQFTRVHYFHRRTNRVLWSFEAEQRKEGPD